MRNQRRRSLAAVLAAVLIGAGCSGGDGGESVDSSVVEATGADGTRSPASSSATTTAGPTTTREPTPTAHVIALYGAINAGDVEGMFTAWPSGDADFFAVLAEGVNERSSVACAPGDTPDSVVCDEFVGNDFFDPAGVRAVYTIRYEVEDDVIATGDLVDSDPAVIEYQEAFGAWLEIEDPDLHASSYQGEGKYPFDTVEQAQAILARLPDFLAQSDEYPLER